METRLTERQRSILQFFYDNQDDARIEDADTLMHYNKYYDYWTEGNDFESALENLEGNGLIYRDKSTIFGFISITDKGIQAYEVT